MPEEVSEDRDTLFGRLAVERGYLTQEQFDDACEAQELGAEAMGVRMPLAQILVAKGLLTRDQAQELRNAVAVRTGEARPAAPKLPYALAGGTLVVLVILGITIVGGPGEKSTERPRLVPPAAVAREPVASLPAPPAAEPEPPAAADPGLARGLVGHWTFDEGKGATARDSSGKGNHGKVAGGAKWTKGRIAGALDFDGSGHVDVDSSVTGFGIADFTVAAWLKTTTNGSSILAKSDGDGIWDDSEKQFYVGAHANEWARGTEGPIGSANMVGHSCGFILGSAVVTDGRWHHVAWTSKTMARVGKAYVDGAECVYRAGYLRLGRDNPGDKVRIGFHSSAEATTNFVGLIDDVRIYDRALSAGEVKALSGGGAAPVTTPDDDVF